MEKQKPIWKKLKDYNGYEVANTGLVRKTGRNKLLRFVQGSGMRRVALQRGRAFHLVVVAELVLEAFHSPKPAGHKAMVKDGNYENLCVENLEWVVRRKEKYKKLYYSSKKRKKKNQ